MLIPGFKMAHPDKSLEETLASLAQHLYKIFARKTHAPEQFKVRITLEVPFRIDNNMSWEQWFTYLDTVKAVVRSYGFTFRGMETFPDKTIIKFE